MSPRGSKPSPLHRGNIRGFDGGSVRPPLRDLDAAEKARVAEVVRRLAGDPRSGIPLAA